MQMQVLSLGKGWAGKGRNEWILYCSFCKMWEVRQLGSGQHLDADQTDQSLGDSRKVAFEATGRVLLCLCATNLKFWKFGSLRQVGVAFKVGSGRLSW